MKPHFFCEIRRTFTQTPKKAGGIVLALAMSMLCGCATTDFKTSGSGGYYDFSDASWLSSQMEDSVSDHTASWNPSTEQGKTWTICLYMCGSDLETNYAAATRDLQEMISAKLPEDVQVVIQTGGAKQWHFDNKANYLNRYLYTSDGLYQLEQNPSSSMGSADTLTDFLTFCKDNFPAQHTMVLFWDHGGGSISGAEFDEQYRYDSLTLDEFHDAFDQVYALNADNPPIDLIGFDTCLMATLETADTFKDTADVLVASQETEPGCGWEYTGWLSALAANPDMDAQSLGKVICQAYEQGCKKAGVSDDITLSVIDLSKIDPLLESYDKLGQEALLAAVEDRSFYPTLARAARLSENYGGNSESSGYTNMIDLGHFVANSSSLLPSTSKKLLNSLDDAIVYQVTGPYHAKATGMSCYHPYALSSREFEKYKQIGSSDAFKQLYNYAAYGNVDEDVLTYIYKANQEESEPVSSESIDTLEAPTYSMKELTDFPVVVNEDGNAVLDLGAETAETLSGVYADLCYFDLDSDTMIKLGRDNDIDMDWKNGTFTDNFRGVWGAIDGHLVYMELVYEGDDYNTYSIPIILNGTPCNLRVGYDYNTDTYEILGARKSVDDNGAVDKYLRPLKAGDEITTIHYASSMDDDDDFEPCTAETFKVTKKTSFEEVPVGDGQFVMFFEMVNPRNESAISAPVVFTVDGDDIYTSTDIEVVSR